jgi:hypothetical protein
MECSLLVSVRDPAGSGGLSLLKNISLGKRFTIEERS